MLYNFHMDEMLKCLFDHFSLFRGKVYHAEKDSRRGCFATFSVSDSTYQMVLTPRLVTGTHANYGLFKLLSTSFLCYLKVSLSGRISKALSREQKLLPRLANQKVRHCSVYLFHDLFKVHG